MKKKLKCINQQIVHVTFFLFKICEICAVEWISLHFLCKKLWFRNKGMSTKFPKGIQLWFCCFCLFVFFCFWLFGFLGVFCVMRHLPVGPLQISKFHAAIVYGQRAWVFRHPMIKIDMNNCFYLEGEIYWKKISASCFVLRKGDE